VAAEGRHAGSGAATDAGWRIDHVEGKLVTRVEATADPLKRKVTVIGIGPGDPECITIQAIEAMNHANVFFIPDKGAEKSKLAAVRRAIIDRYVRNKTVRTVEYRVPSRRSSAEDAYDGAVADWHAAISEIFRRLILDELGESQIGAFLVWGDPSLYDSTLRILDRLRAERGFELEYDVIPGVSSVQALAARHGIALNEIGRAVLVSNGRGLAEGFPATVDSVVVLLNAEKALRDADGELDAYWGAYIGMPEEILISGRLKDIVEDIERTRAAARKENGWIMDALVLKKPRRDLD
jgi:precorrin-6A synthase